MTAASRLDVVVGRALGTVLMTVRGRLHSSMSERFRAKLDKVLDEAPERVVIDLTDATVDEGGIVLLREAKSSAQDRQVQLVLTSRKREALTAIEAVEDTTVA